MANKIKLLGWNGNREVEQHEMWGGRGRKGWCFFFLLERRGQGRNNRRAIAAIERFGRNDGKRARRKKESTAASRSPPTRCKCFFCGAKRAPLDNQKRTLQCTNEGEEKRPKEKRRRAQHQRKLKGAKQPPATKPLFTTNTRPRERKEGKGTISHFFFRGVWGGAFWRRS